MEKRKLLSLFLALTMLFMSIPVELFAEGEAAETVTVVEEAPVEEVKEEAPAPAAEPVVEKKEEAPAPKAEPVQEVKEEAPAPAAEPVVEEKEEAPAPVAEPVVEEKEEAPAPAEEPAVEEQPAEEPAAEPAAEEQPAEEPAAEPAAEEQPVEEPAVEPAVEEQPAEEPVAEPVVEEVPAEEPVAEEPAETVEEAFKAGLAKLSAGDVFADKKLQKVFGKLDAEAVVYAAERVSGEGELANDDVIRVAANIEGEIKSAYVKNARLTYLDEAAVAAYLEDQHDNGVAYNGVKLDPVAFTPAEAEEDNAAAESVEEAEPVETTDVPAEEPAEAVAEPAEETPAEEPVPEAADELAEETEPAEPEADIPAEEVEPAEEASEEPADGTVLYYATVKLATQKSISLRSSESRADSAKTKVSAAKGEQVAVLSESGEWAYVRSAEGEGYILQKFLEKIDEVATAETEETDEILLSVEKLNAGPEVDAVTLEEEELKEVTSNTLLATASSLIVITNPPVNVTAEIGETVSFSIEAEGVKSYQWEWYTGTEWRNTSATGNKTNAITLEVTAARYAYQYRCVMTDADGATLISDPVRILRPFAITAQPVSVEGAIGDTVSFTVEATGVKSYQWEWYTGTEWRTTSATGNKTKTISVEVTEARYAYQYRCVLTGDDDSTLITEPVRILSTFAITTQPVSVDGEIGDTVSFTVEATGVKSYQWQWYTGTEWRTTSATGNKTKTITVEVTEARYAYQYRCVLTGTDDSTLITDPVRILRGFAITTQPTSVEGAIGDTVSFTVEATGVKSYQWQWYTGTEWRATSATGNKTKTISVEVTEARYAYQYRCVLTGVDGSTLTSDAVRILGGLSITTQPVSVEGAIGDTVSFTVEATGVKSYQWQWYTGTEWRTTSATGNKTKTITVEVTEARYAYQYRCVLTGSDGSTVISDPVRILRGFAITTQPISVEGAIGDTVSFTVEATGVKSYQWQWYTGTEWRATSATGNKTKTISVEVTEARYAYQYRCVLTGFDGSTLTSDPVRILRGFVITAQPESVEGEIGDTVSFTVEADGVKSYQWQWYTGTEWRATSATGNKTKTISVEVTEARYAYEYRCVLTGFDGSTLTSEAVRILRGFAITTQPENVEGAIGDTVSFTVEATGVKSYQWQWYTGTEWRATSATGNKTKTISVEVTEARYAYQYRCVLTGFDGSTLTSDPVRITRGFAITTQPEDAMGNVDENVSFSVVATGVKSYQWESYNGTEWTPVTASGSQTDTMILKVTKDQYSYKYRCVLTGDSGDTLETNEVAIIGFVLDNVKYLVLDGNSVSVAKYMGNAASLVIPEAPNGMTVTEIGEKAFEDNTSIESISLPDTITVIRKRAFAGCSSLKEMN